MQNRSKAAVCHGARRRTRFPETFYSYSGQQFQRGKVSVAGLFCGSLKPHQVWVKPQDYKDGHLNRDRVPIKGRARVKTPSFL